MFNILQGVFGGKSTTSVAQAKDSKCDLLIIGAGPAGLMAALWASRCGINFRILDKRPKGIFKGQADGLQCRSMEIFESFGFARRVEDECCPSIEMCFWNPSESGNRGIRRADRVPECIPGSSNYGQVLLHQGRIERFFVDAIKEKTDIEVERGVLPEELDLDHTQAEEQDAYPVTVKVRHPKEHENGCSEGMLETIRARYLVGCDGAHSWTRRQLGFTMEGEQTDFVWGVIDMVPITDFPDIRMACSIHSAESGSILLIPRERKLVRVYVQLTDIKKADGQDIDRSSITSEMILKAARKIFQPYTLDWGYIEWWAVYQIGQRVGNKFSAADRIFLAGDAVHTHSPKAGQGMNVSMQDCYNLGWKLSAVINGLAKRSILKTYEAERKTVAHELIAFDHRFSRLFSGRPARDTADETGISVAEFKAEFEKSLLFASGLSVDYGPSSLVAKPRAELAESDDNAGSSAQAQRWVIAKPALAQNIKLGMRLPSFQVLNQSDARPWQFSHLLKSDGRWRIVLFAGNVERPAQLERVSDFCSSLSAPSSFLHRFTPSTARIDSVIEILTIHSAPRTATELLDLPELLHPFDEQVGWDYAKVFVDDWSYHRGHGKAYEKYGVDAERGCVVVARPDQYVGWIGELEDVAELGAYFEGILVEQE